MNQFKQYPLLCVTVWAGVSCSFFVAASEIQTNDQLVTIQDRPELQRSVVYPQEVKKSVSLILYIPPKPAEGGRPDIRTTQGGTRGNADNALPVVTLLTPDQQYILTADSQPVLYWHLSSASQNPVVVTLTAEEDEPLLEYVISEASDAGLHSLRLAEQGVSLSSGKSYEWSVCVQQGEDEFLACDLIARSFIQLTVPSESINRSIDVKTNPEEKAEILARNGFWYDALKVLMEASLSVESQRLLQQVGLSFP